MNIFKHTGIAVRLVSICPSAAAQHDLLAVALEIVTRDSVTVRVTRKFNGMHPT